MADAHNGNSATGHAADSLSEQVGKKEQRKLHARAERSHGVWFGLGMFGVVGWSIAIPTLIGIAIGLWIDETWETPFSYTVMCLAAGVMAGCGMAWYWIVREGRLHDGDRSSSSAAARAEIKEETSTREERGTH